LAAAKYQKPMCGFLRVSNVAINQCINVAMLKAAM